MPHQCTNCGRVFADGSKEMLSGCPNCGGNKFQFSPSKANAGRDTAETTGRREASSETTASSSEATDSDPAPADDASGSTTWRRAASRAADIDDGERRTRSRDAQTGQRAQTENADVDTARRRGQTLREWANSRGFASEVEDEKDETTLRENRRRTGDAQRRPPERRPTAADDDAAERPDRAGTADSPESTETDAPSDRVETDALSGSSRPADEPRPPANSPADAANPADAPSAPDTSNAPNTADAPNGPDGSPTPDDDGENDAQASARSDVVSPDEIRAASEKAPPTDADGRVIEPRSEDRPNLDELREELNDQFESIKIVAPGEYELNLMELYDRPEYIISLREDGRYVIEVPNTWSGPEDV